LAGNVVLSSLAPSPCMLCPASASCVGRSNGLDVGPSMTQVEGERAPYQGLFSLVGASLLVGVLTGLVVTFFRIAL
jgi:hypothetical protein